MEYRKQLVHSIRVAILVCIALLMRSQQKVLTLSNAKTDIQLSTAQELFPQARSLSPGEDRVKVLDESDNQIGFVRQTSPASDDIVGFSGSTNVLIGFSPDERILGLRVIRSGDTRDHVRQVVEDEQFMLAMNGLTADEAKRKSVDAVSGATLTSLAMLESVAVRLGAEEQKSLRFPDPPSLEAIQTLFSDAAYAESTEVPTELSILDTRRVKIGWVLRTSPAADNTIGYQGPTEALIGLDAEAKVIGVTLLKSYDNEPYVGYVRDDAYFASLFNTLDVEELSKFDLAESEFEGVSGATMTSTAVAEGIIATAVANSKWLEERSSKTEGLASPVWFRLTVHDWGTLLCIVLGCIIGLTKLRANRTVGFLWQIVLVVYLGLTAGSLLSQAQLVGWARHGVSISNAFGLFCLAVVGLSIPVATKRNLYCTHLCPHGAAQQLLKRRLPWKVTLTARWKLFLSMIPGLLLIWCIVVGMTTLNFSLVDIEPFDAYVFRIAGWATIAIAVVGLVASLFIPMAYCRFGCPTGAMLEFLRFNAKADRWNRRDWFAAGALLLVIGFRIFGNS